MYMIPDTYIILLSCNVGKTPITVYLHTNIVTDRI
jgi:hypothetical protein